MNQTEIILQANLCDSCNGVWFTPHFKSEGEQSTCPYCKSTLTMNGKPTDLANDAEEMKIPEEIKSLMERKTSGPLAEKECVFCTNFLLVAREDVEKAGNCPYCGDKLIMVQPNAGGSQQSQQESNPILDRLTLLDDLKMKPVLMTLIDSRNWLQKLITKRPTTIPGIYLGSCPITQIVRMLVQPQNEIEWFPIAHIEKIQEILIDEVVKGS